MDSIARSRGLGLLGIGSKEDLVIVGFAKGKDLVRVLCEIMDDGLWSFRI